MTTSTDPRLGPGLLIQGKWNGETYRVIRRLGAGANGAVYLVRRGDAGYAMKIGFDPLELQSEINALASVPSRKRLMTDADDFVDPVTGKEYAYYVMPFAQGKNLRDFLSGHGDEWLAVIVSRLLQAVGELHASGWIFGDIKPENVIVSDYGQVTLVDYGGMTPIGKSVRQFTELFDRGYWHAGSRQADIGYDLFSIAAMLVLVKSEPSGGMRHASERSVERLLEMAGTTTWGRKAKPFLHKAWTGRYATAAEAFADWRRLLPSVASAKQPAARFGWMEGAFVLSLLLCAGAFYLLIR